MDEYLQSIHYGWWLAGYAAAWVVIIVQHRTIKFWQGQIGVGCQERRDDRLAELVRKLNQPPSEETP